MASEYIKEKAAELHTENLVLRRELRQQILKTDMYRILALMGWAILLAGITMRWFE